jgi:HlyD family secretion protein
VACAAVLLLVLSGCTAAHYRRSADNEVYKIIQQVDRQVLGQTNAFTIETPYSKRKPTDILPAELIEDRTQTNRRILTLSEALNLAVQNSREYQAQKEQLYLVALTLTGARYEFTPIFFANSTAQITGSPEASDIGSVRTHVGVSQLFRTGGRLSVSLANDLLRYFTGLSSGGTRNSAINVVSADLTQPLLQGFGQNDPRVEELTQAERNVVYGVRTFSQFQKQFDVNIVNDYFRLLGLKAIVRNNYTNYLRRVDLTQFTEARAVDRVRRADVADTQTAELSAKISYINSVAAYLNQLDAFKLRLGVPLTESLYLNDVDLRELEKAGLVPVPLSSEAAFQIAAQKNLELLNAIDRFEDSKRKVRVAAERSSRNTVTTTAHHKVRRGDFSVTVVEGGTLAAVREISIRNEVEGTARIISIVPEGSYVKKGDLLVELDSSQARDHVNQQQISFEKAKFAVEQAKAQLEILKSTTNSDFLAAELKLKFAKLDREKWEQGQRLVDMVEASNKLVQADVPLAINLDTYVNSTNLAAKGYETKQKVDADRLAVLNNRNSLVVASNGIWILQQFDIPKQRETFDANVLQAEQELQRVISQNERKMAQAVADLSSQINTLALSEEKLQRDQKNLEATKIYAPQDGLVVYAVSDSHFSSESLIEGGAIVRKRQELIKLPDLSHMKVMVKIHESHVNMIRPGLPAFVVLDSAPDERYRGVVEKVAPLPDTQSRWGNPNLKVYNTDIYLTEALPNVKPGVSAQTEVIVTNIANTLSVPIQAVTTLKGKQVVYLANGGKPEPKPVEVGMFNTKFIEVLKGVNEGDLVLLSPPFDNSEKDLPGALAAEGEARHLTNAPPPQGKPDSAGPNFAGSQKPVAPGGDPQSAEAGASGQRRALGRPDRTVKRC